MNVSSFRQSFDRSWARLVGGQGGVEGEKDVAPESHVKITKKKVSNAYCGRANLHLIFRGGQ